MSRHFNYELNEKRIKALLQENALSYKDEYWSEYIEKYRSETRPSRAAGIKSVPIQVNKNVVLSVGFIILIFAFTFLIARLIDFGSGTKADKSAEVELIPDASSFALPKNEQLKLDEDSDSPLSNNLPAADTVVVKTEQAEITEKKESAPQTTINVQRAPVYPALSNSLTTSSSNESSDTSQAKSALLRNKNKKKQPEVLEAKPVIMQLPNNSEEEEPELKK